jgi:hypothetical protein
MAVPGKLRPQTPRRKFDPRQFGNCKLWLADERWQDSGFTTLATADGDPVGAWSDFSGLKNHATQSGSTLRPALKTNIQNGRAVVRPDGVNDYLQLATPIALAHALVIYCVGRRNAAGQMWIPLGSTTSSDDITLYTDDKAYFVASGTVIGATYTGPNNQHILARWLRDASNNVTFRSTGQAETTLGTATGSITLDAIDARPFNGFYQAGDFDELIVYDGDIAGSGRAAVERYLQDRWAVTF